MKEFLSRYRNQIFALLRTLAAYLVLPNLLFGLVGTEIEILPRALVNLDYLGIGAVAPFVSGGTAMCLLGLAVLADVFRCSGSIFFFSQRDAVSALAFVRELPASRVAEISVAIIVFAIGLSWVMIRLGGRGVAFKSSAPWIAMLAVSFGAIGVWGGNSSLRFRDDAATSNLCSSAGISILKAVFSSITRKSDYVAPVMIDSATRRAGLLDGAPETQNVVLVVVESGGEPLDGSWKALLNTPFASAEIKARYEVMQGTVGFSGATVPGELRELCGFASGVLDLPPEEVLGQCLPGRMRSLGFETHYAHGFSATMFRRSELVPQLGFINREFHPEFKEMGVDDCGGPFRGSCDAAVAGWIGDYLVANPKRRIWFEWLTLNSHLPVYPDRDSAEILGCGTPAAQVSDEASCNLVGLLIRAESAVAKLATRPDLPETEFVIVGDHAPPFLQRTRRERFSQSVVPYTILKPKKEKKIPRMK